MHYLMIDSGGTPFLTTDDAPVKYKTSLCGGGSTCYRFDGPDVHLFQWNAGESFWQPVEWLNSEQSAQSTPESTAAKSP
jgi:hypothetical protein